MPPSKQRARTHDENRAEVCVMHPGKGSSMRPISNVDLARIREFFPSFLPPDYDPDDQKSPRGICAKDRKLLYELATKKRKEIPILPSFPPLDFGGLTGRQLKDLQDCICTFAKLEEIMEVL